MSDPNTEAREFVQRFVEGLPTDVQKLRESAGVIRAALEQAERALEQEREITAVLERFLRDLGYDDNDFADMLASSPGAAAEETSVTANPAGSPRISGEYSTETEPSA